MLDTIVLPRRLAHRVHKRSVRDAAVLDDGRRGWPAGEGQRVLPDQVVNARWSPTDGVLHGANDTNVPLVEAEQMVDELRKRNVEVASVIFPDDGHGFTKTANRTRAAVETVRWFAGHL
jgi:acetyl esterase/lipase